MGIAKEFQSRLDRIRSFAPHNLTSGTTNEIILRDFLSRHAPQSYDVAQGFICDPTKESAVSKQCDILVYEQQSHPVVYSDGPIKVVWPTSARLVVEVKTNFNHSDIKSSLENIDAAKRIGGYNLQGVVFAFKSPKLGTIINHLQTFQAPENYQNKPLAIFLFDKGVIIHRWSYSRMRDLEVNPVEYSKDIGEYSVRIAKKEKGAVVIIFLLMIFFQSVDIPMLDSTTANLLLEMIDSHTERILPDIRIGNKQNS